MIRLTLVYSLAFTLGLAAAYLVLRLNAIESFSPNGSLSNIMITGLIMPPLAGLSIFSLVFGLAMRWSLGAKFWVISLALVFGLIICGVLLIYSGFLTFFEALSGIIILLFAAGWWLFHTAMIQKGTQDG